MAQQKQEIQTTIRDTPPEKIMRAGQAVELRYASGGGDYLRKVSVYELLPDKRQVIISQPKPAVYADDIRRQIDITAICRFRSEYLRVGTRAWVSDILKNYELVGEKRVGAVQLTYEPQLARYNLRSYYRLSPSGTYQVRASFVSPGGTEVPQSEIEVMDISCMGLGLHLSKESLDPAVLTELDSGAVITVEVNLIDDEHPRGKENHSTQLKCEGEIARTRAPQDTDVVTVGVKFRKFHKREVQWPIASFINAAQRYELRERLTL